MALQILLLLVGLALLFYAGDQFVLAASRIATVLRLRPIVVGAVVLGFGTSAPEMVVSALSAVRGDPALGVGNIVGSNVANLSLGLGVAALLAPVVCEYALLRKEAALSVGSTVVFALLVLDRDLVVWEGIVLAVLLLASITVIIRSAGSPVGMPAELVSDLTAASPAKAGRQSTHHRKYLGIHLLRTLLGLGGVLVGAQLAVTASINIAEGFGLSEGFIGFSVVAVGTSLPELATVVAAARKGQTQLILGNLFGSNLFNSLAVSGAMGLVGAGEIMDDTLTSFGIGAMVVMSLTAYFLAFTRRRVARAEGLLLLLLYVAAMTLLGVFNSGT